MYVSRCVSDRYAVRFVPRENGVHFIHVRLNGNHIPGSPFRVLVGRQDADAGLVRAYGDGLSRGMTGTSAFIKYTIPVCVCVLESLPQIGFIMDVG